MTPPYATNRALLARQSTPMLSMDSKSGKSGSKQTERQAQSSVDSHEPWALLNNRRLLIVEDSPVDREIHRSTATSLGMKIDLAIDGETAIQMLQDADKNDPYELVLIDFQMPNLDGLTASRYIKQEIGLLHKPAIVLMSAYKSDEIFKKPGDQNGVDAYLTKPVSRDLLAATFQQILKSNHDHASKTVDKNQVASSHRTLADCHILIAEDNPVNQRVAIAILQRKSIKVSVANNGQQAIDMVLNAEPNTFDLVLMDVDMPFVDGFDATVKIKSDSTFQHLPVVALTAQNSSEIKQRAKQAGMTAFLTKPVKPAALYETLLDQLDLQE